MPRKSPTHAAALLPPGLVEGQYIDINEYRCCFSARSAPSEHTIRRWLQAGKLSGIQIGKGWFIDRVAVQTGGNPLVAKILSHGPAA